MTDRTNIDGQICDELAHALAQMTEMTCPAMRCFWLEATKRLRQKYFDAPAPDFPAHLATSPRVKTTYKTLATWRHGVVWQEFHRPEPPQIVFSDLKRKTPLTEGDVERYPAHCESMNAIYFTEVPNEPPYSYSRKKSASPKIDKESYSEVNILRDCAKACWTSIQLLQLRWWDAVGGPQSDFLRHSIKNKTLDDVLKLRDYRKRTVGTDRYCWNGPTKESEIEGGQ